MTVHVFPKKKIWGHHAVIERVRHFIHRMVETLDDAIDFRAIHREFKFLNSDFTISNIVASLRQGGCSFVTYLLPRSDLIRPTRQSRRRT